MIKFKDPGSKSIAFDYDGVVLIPSPSGLYHASSAYNEMMIWLMLYLRWRGWNVTVNTARDGEAKAYAADSLTKRLMAIGEAPFHFSEGKPVALIYVDDRNVGGLPTIEHIIHDCGDVDGTSVEGFLGFLKYSGWEGTDLHGTWSKTSCVGEVMIPYDSYWVRVTFPSRLMPKVKGEWRPANRNGRLAFFNGSVFLDFLLGVGKYPYSEDTLSFFDSDRTDYRDSILRKGDKYLAVCDYYPYLPMVVEGRSYEEALDELSQMESCLSRLEVVTSV